LPGLGILVGNGYHRARLTIDDRRGSAWAPPGAAAAMAATPTADAMERSVPFNDDRGVIIELGKDSQVRIGVFRFRHLRFPPLPRLTSLSHARSWMSRTATERPIGRLATYSRAGAVTDARPVAGSNGVDACSWVTTQ